MCVCMCDERSRSFMRLLMCDIQSQTYQTSSWQATRQASKEEEGPKSESESNRRRNDSRWLYDPSTKTSMVGIILIGIGLGNRRCRV